MTPKWIRDAVEEHYAKPANKRTQEMLEESIARHADGTGMLAALHHMRDYHLLGDSECSTLNHAIQKAEEQA